MAALTWFTFTFLLFGMLVMVMASTKFISQGTAGIVERMGKYVKTVGPGVHFITPIFSRMIRISMKLQVVHYPPQKIVTKDNLQVGLNTYITFRIIDTKKATYDVEDYHSTMEALIGATMLAFLGGMSLSECLESREILNQKMQHVLDEHTSEWGIKVVAVAIKEISIPDEMVHIMMKAKQGEIDANYTVRIAEGTKKANIARAEGEAKARVLNAEGQRDALKATAEGQKQAFRLEAEGRAQAYESLFTALNKSGISNEIIAIRYLEALEKVAQGEATTLILPYESSGLLGAIAGIAKTMSVGNGDPVKKATDMFMDEPNPDKTPEITPDA